MRSKYIQLVIFILFAITFLFKAYYLDKAPLHFDETLYAQMIAEEAQNLSFLPTYLGDWAAWKPGLYFIVYSFFYHSTSRIFDSIEWIYRAPNLLFSIINAILIYFIAKRFTKPTVALIAALLFYASYGAIYTEGRLLMEVFALTPILLSLLFYTAQNLGPTKRFLAAGFFALLAALTKSVISFMILPLAVAYLFQYDRKNLNNPFFLISLLAPFIGFFIFYLALDSQGLVQEVLVQDTGKFFIFDWGSGLIRNLGVGITFFFMMYWAYIVVSFRVIFTSWKQYLFFSMWVLVALVPLLSAEPHEWHFYYVVPALAFFAAIAVSNNGRVDAFSLLLVVLLVGANLGTAVFGGLISDSPIYLDSREVGTDLAGKENVLIVGNYPAVTIIVAYKILNERKETGSYLDFGYVILHTDDPNLTSKDWIIPLNAVVQDYYTPDTDEYEFVEDFAYMFGTDKFIRKPTDIKEFDYVVVSPSNIPVYDSRYELLHNYSLHGAIYVRSEHPEENQIK